VADLCDLIAQVPAWPAGTGAASASSSSTSTTPPVTCSSTPPAWTPLWCFAP